MLGNRTTFLSETGLMQSRKWLSSSYIKFSRVAAFLGTRGNRFYYSQVPFSLLCWKNCCNEFLLKTLKAFTLV